MHSKNKKDWVMTTTELLDRAWEALGLEMYQDGSALIPTKMPSEMKNLLRIVDYMIKQRMFEHIERENHVRTHRKSLLGPKKPTYTKRRKK